VIYDDADQLSLVRDLQREQGIDDKAFPARRLLSAVSNAKNLAVARRPSSREPGARRADGRQALFLYAERLRSANAMDFDDLILRPWRFSRRRPRWPRGGAAGAGTSWWTSTRTPITPSTGSYGPWRRGTATSAAWGTRINPSTASAAPTSTTSSASSATSRNQARQAGAELPLHEAILEAASSVVENNAGRIGRRSGRKNAEGEALDLYCAADDQEEASYVAERIASGSRRPAETAVLYRTNAQSRLFEEALSRHAVPYRIIGGVRFYDRREIKDIVAYLKLMVNPDDEVAWKRIVNVPPREIGKTSVELIEEIAAKEHHPFPAAARIAVERSLLTAAASGPEGLPRTPGGAAGNAGGDGRGSFMAMSSRGFATASTWRDGPEDLESRLENLDELITAVGSFPAARRGSRPSWRGPPSSRRSRTPRAPAASR